MTLDEAIAIADEIGKGDTVRAANNRWLAGKLRILKWVEECHVIGEVRRAREEMHRWQTECVSLKAENEKLRELVRDMMRFFENGDWCTECNHARECESQEQYEDECLMRFVFRDRMCELGVEA